jgi:hypothetical protein
VPIFGTEKTMASPTLSSLITLKTEEINREVAKTSAGVYALDATIQAVFTFSYVGRSDNDVAGRLKTYVGSKYKFFKFAYCSSDKSAFEAECELYHDHHPPDNINHPARPEGSNWKCPRCKVFD